MKPNRIKAIRYELGLTQEQVASSLGIPLQRYACKENGKYKFNDEEKAKMRVILNLSVDTWNDLFYEGKLPIGE